VRYFGCEVAVLLATSRLCEELGLSMVSVLPATGYGYNCDGCGGPYKSRLVCTVDTEWLRVDLCPLGAGDGDDSPRFPYYNEIDNYKKHWSEDSLLDAVRGPS